ncbi:MAG: hypothetical protein U0232_06060 [Thermomicrobiales bacterium]
MSFWAGAKDPPPRSFAIHLELSAGVIDTFDSCLAAAEGIAVSVLREVQQRLVLLESKLGDRPEEAGEVRAIRQLLDSDKGEWIGTVEAQRLLGMHSVNTVKAWAKRGWLRSKEAAERAVEGFAGGCCAVARMQKH